MKAGMIQQCGNCCTPVDEKWTKVDEHGIHICPYCGVVNDFSDNDVIAEEFEKFRSIYAYLDNLKFDAATDELENLRQLYPKSSQVYFLSVLAENCVCYTPDGEDETRRIPTLNDLPTSNLLDTSFAKKALELAESDLVKETYLETFNYIEKIRNEIQRDANNPEYHYDIFISTKVNLLDENGNEVKDGNGNTRESPDCANARDLYNYITEKYKGLRVFFSQTTDAKEKMAGQKYENVIFSALHSARAFILVCESRQSVEWRWVRNEWKRYLRIMKREKPGDRNFVLWTKNLKPEELPGEFRSINYIKSDLVNSGDQLKSFLGRAFGKKEQVQKIKGSTFTDTEVETIAPVEIEDDFQVGGGLRTRVEEATADIKAEVARISRALDPKFKSRREEAFQDLEILLKENPDVYEAQKLMLLKDTNFASLDEYLRNPNEIDKNPQILASFLEFASVEDGKGALLDLTKKIADEDFYFDYNPNDAAIPENVGGWSAKLANSLSSIVLKYLNDIDTKQLKVLRNRLANTVMTELTFATPEQEEVLNGYLTLCRFLSGKDSQAYIDVRKNVILSFKRFYPKNGERVVNIQKRLVEEILKINPGEYNTIWMDFCLRRFGNPYNSEDGIDEFIADAKAGRIELSTVGDEETINLFKNLFKYTRKEERALYTYAFLTLIICDPHTYEQQVLEEGTSLSEEEKNSANKADHELDGISLFSKYVSYPLPTVYYPTTIDKKFDISSPLLTPNTNAYLKKKKPTPLDNLLCTFAVALHKKALFDDAVKFYDLYLAQQDSIITFDCLLIRFYKELATVRVRETEDLKRVGQPIQHKDIDRDCIRLGEDYPAVMCISDKIAIISEYQAQYFDKYQQISNLVDRLPRERTVEKLDLIVKTGEEIKKVLKSLSSESDQAVKNELKREFAMEIEYFDKQLPELKKAAERLGTLFADNNNGRMEKLLTEGYRDTEKAYYVAKENADKYQKDIDDFDNPGLKKAHTSTLKALVNKIHDKMLADAHRRKAKRFFGGLFTFLFAFLFPLVELLVPAGVVMSFLDGMTTETTRLMLLIGGGTTILHQFAISFIDPEKLKYGSGRVAHHMSRIVSLIAALFLTVYSFPFISVLIGGFEIYDTLHIMALVAAMLIYIILIVRMYRNKDGDGVSVNVGGLSYIFLRILLLIVPAFCAISMFSNWGSCFTDYMLGCGGGTCEDCSCACFGVACYLSDSGVAFVSTPDLFAGFGYFAPSQILFLFVGMIGLGVWSLVNILTHASDNYAGYAPRPYMRIASIITIIVCALYVLLGGLALINGLLATTCQACTFFCYNCGCATCIGCFDSDVADATSSVTDSCAFGSNQTNLLIGAGFAALGGLTGAANIIEQR